MTITQTVEIPADRQITLTVPREIPTGKVIVAFTPVTNVDIDGDCPICVRNARNIDPETGNPRYNAETVAAIEEGRAMMRGEIPAKRFSSFKEMLEDLERDDEDD